MATYHSGLGSILFTTACVVTFAMLAGPVMRPVAAAHDGIEVRAALRSSTHTVNLRVAAGKSLLVDSPAGIVRASVGKPEFAAATSIGDHELLINGKTPGDTNVTFWEVDGKQKQLQLHVEPTSESTGAVKLEKRDVPRQVVDHGVVASYENAMNRVETAITGVSR